MPEPQIRSYHRAFRNELLIYRLGNIRLYRPLPARAVFWTGIWVAVIWIASHVLNWHLQMMTIPWAFVYGVVPVVLGWVFGAGEIEGRRLHVIAPVWFQHMTAPRRLVGGWRKQPDGPERWRMPRRMRMW